MEESLNCTDSGPKAFFLYYLVRLENLVELSVDKRQSDAGRDSLLQERLAPDMFPFAQQVSTAAGFSLRALCPLAGVGIPDFEQPKTAEQLRLLIERTSRFLRRLPEVSLQDLEGKSVATRAGYR